MTMALTTDLVRFFILVTVLSATFSLSSSKNTEQKEELEQRKSPSIDEISRDSNSVDPSENIKLPSTSESVCRASQIPEKLDNLIDTKVSDKFEAILKFKNIMMEERSKLLSSISNTECDHNYQRILHGEYSAKRSCSDDIDFVIAAARMRIQWALEMIGANGEPGLGTLHDAVRPLGDFKQCMDLNTGQDFEGRYCTTNIGISQIQQKNLSHPLYISLGLCFPSSCGNADVERIINEYFESRNDILAKAAYTNCQERELELSTTAKIVISICSIYATLLVVATVYDALYKRWWLEIQENGHHSFENNVPKKEASVTKNNSEHELISTSEKQRKKLSPKDVAGSQQTSNKSGMMDQILVTFSLYTNIANLFSTHETKGSIGCIHGLRFISVAHIVLVHLLPFGVMSLGNLRVYLDDGYKRWLFMIIFKGDVAVDTFFTISGLLMTYLVFKDLSTKPVTPKFFLNFYIHRIWRLLPSVMLIMMTYAPLIKYLGKGPLWPQGGFEINECKNGWWVTMLFLNNFLKLDEWCMGWTWYLSCDMQFYIISPLIYLPLFYYGWKGVISPFVFLLVSMICGGIITMANDLVAIKDLEFLLTGEQDYYLPYYYFNPFARIGPYIIGIFTGFLMTKTNMKARLSKWVVILGWIASTVTILAVMFGLFEHVKQENQKSIGIRALYNALSRTAWGMSISWIIFACANGYGGFVNTLLSWKALIPLGRMSFCAYLVHPIVMQYFSLTRENLIRLNDPEVISSLVSSTVLTYALGFVACVVYELPMTRLEKVVKAYARRKE